jgi:trimeric autotransporter adhesin
MTTGRIPSIEGGIQPTIFDAKADILTATAADTPARLAVGANDTVLTADSAEATGLKWATPSSGSMTQLATGTLSGSTLTLSSISASYQDLLLVCNNFYPSANSYLSIKVNNTADIYARTSTTSSSNPINTAQIDFSNSEVYNADKDNYLAFRIDNYANTTSNKFGFENWILGNTAGTSWNIGQAIDAIRTTSAINRIDLILTAGSFSAGTYTLYGVK